LLILAALSTVGLACRRESVLVRQGDVVILGAYAYPSAGDAGAAYLRIANRGSATDTLLAVAGPQGSTGMVMTTTDGRMTTVAGIGLASGETLAMLPGGTHVMFSGLPRSYAVGDTFPLTVRFARAGEVLVPAPVVPYGEMP
jgi:copper(I)-binding protein